MNTNLLHAVDTVYLRAFRQNLLDALLRACVSLKHCLGQSTSLAEAQELPAAFRQNYREVAEGLPPLISALRSMLDEMEGGSLSSQNMIHPLGWELTTSLDIAEAIAMLDATEIEILNILNGVGKSLAALSPSIISWDGCARLRTRATLQRVAERPCYDLEIPIDICVYPFLIAEYSTLQTQANSDRWPHYLVDEIMPAALLSSLDGIHVEVEVRGEVYASCRPQGPGEA